MSTVTPSAANGLALGTGKDLARMTSWGLRGTEDLGPGLKALLVLESGFGVDDGRSQQGGRLLGRQAYVGLDHAAAGKLTFGRQYTSLFDVLANFSPTEFGLQYEPMILGTGVNCRSDNVAKYTGQFGGLTAVTHWPFGNGV
ncbi:porin [Cupriavidus sp.]|uniref:porin n=1 Tax=Cupriavidus sp. TaxID=1873897 RepID=UPI003D0E3643